MTQPQVDMTALASEVIAQMMAANGGSNGAGVRRKAVSSTPTTTYGHGPYGLFSYPGMSRPLFNAMILPNQGLQSLLPVRPSNDANPVYGILTGVTATTGSEPEGVCDDPPTAGLTKLCMHSFVFGRQSRQTRVFDLDRIGLWTNRGEFGDFTYMGDPLRTSGVNPNVPTIAGGNPADVAKNEISKALFELAVAWSRDFAKELYTGNPTNNTAGGGRKYFYGLDILINTGYRDAESGIACPAADSLVRSFGDNRVELNGTAIVQTITAMFRNLKYIAARAGLDPVEWVLSMRWGLFYQLTEVWPCAYMTYRCQNSGAFSTSQVQFNDAGAQIAMRDEMRGNIFDMTGQYLLIDGQRVPVVLDEAIAETEPVRGVFESSIYFVPLTVLGGNPVTFIEHRNYDAPGNAVEAARFFAPDGSFYASDNGRFLWHKKPPTNFCVQMLAKTEPRVLLLTPQIAGRLTDVRYSPLIHERDSFTDAGYFVNGGSTSRGIAPSLFSPTA
jgi:hypothetical protein